MKWTKLKTKQWLTGALRKYPPEIRAVWPDLMALADQSSVPGVVCAGPGIPYSLEQLADLTNTRLHIFEQAVALFSMDGYIKHKDGCIALTDWQFIQSEYRRQKKYRVTKKSNKHKDVVPGLPAIPLSFSFKTSPY